MKISLTNILQSIDDVWTIYQPLLKHGLYMWVKYEQHNATATKSYIVHSMHKTLPIYS